MPPKKPTPKPKQVEAEEEKPQAAAPAARAAAAAAPAPAKPANPVADSSAVSLDPDDFTSGLMSDGNYVITDIGFTRYDFNGKVDSPRLMLGVEYVGDDNRPHTDYLGLGGSDADPIESHFTESEDGSRLLRQPEGRKSSLNRQCKAARFLASLKEAFAKAGKPYPNTNGPDGIRALNGTFVYMTRLLLPKSEDVKFQRKSGEAPSVMVADHLIEPFEYTKPAAEDQPQTAPATAHASTNASADMDNATDAEINDTITAVMDVLNEAPGNKLTKQQLNPALLRLLSTNPNKKRMIQLAYRSDFLKKFASEPDGPYWDFDGNTITALASE